MSFKPDHSLHTKRRGRNTGVLLVLLSFVALLFIVTIVKLGENGVAGNPSAAQGGAWIDGFRDMMREEE
ncbi:MAG: hypothetical protein AAGF44_09605 [Pseudomonadota bacterium]